MSERLQILALAGEGMSRDEIAAALEMEPAAVEFVLAREGMVKEEEISDDDFEEIKNGLIRMAKNSDNEYIRSKVGMYLYDRKKGPVSAMVKAPAVNIAQLNMLIAASSKQVINSLNGNHNESVRSRAQSAIGEAGKENGETIECPPEHSKD